MNIPGLDSLLDGMDIDITEEEDSELVEFEGIDPRLKQLSHSSRTLLHKCPRKFQLYRLNSKESDNDDVEQGITFSYGTAVGVGLQSTLEGKTEDQILFDTFLAWNQADLLEENQRQQKSIWTAIFAVQRFIAMRNTGYLEDYELVYWKGKPAVELSFRVHLPDGYTYRGYIDAVLRHKETGVVLVLEAKTSSGKPNSAQYKNSGQALGYSVVLDKIFPNLSSYYVLYLVYGTREKGYTEFHFEKSLLLRALWLQELFLDKIHIDTYEEYSTYPMHGESCYDFFRECPYLGLCTLPTERLVKPLTQGALNKIEEEEYDFELDFFDLVEAQLEKGES